MIERLAQLDDVEMDQVNLNAHVHDFFEFDSEEVAERFEILNDPL